MARRSKGDAKTIFSVASGNFLEMYDFAVYGFYAAFIAKVFFPAQSEFISLMQIDASYRSYSSWILYG